MLTFLILNFTAWVLIENLIYAFKTHMNTIWIHIEIRRNSRTETSIIVRLMMTQYKGRNM
jgi:hypothetical protein